MLYAGSPPRARANASELTPGPVESDTRFEGIEQLVQDAVARRELLGCVVAIGSAKGSIYMRAFGERAHGERMSLDTIFDLASLTKPIATATSIALLAA